MRTAARAQGRDGFMFVAKLATVVVLSGTGVAFFVAAASSDGPERDAEVTVPAVPPIADPGGRASAQPEPPAPSPTTTVVAPTVGSRTAVIVPEPTTSPRPTTTRSVDEGPFAQLGRRCAPEGTFAVANGGFGMPVVCQNGRWVRVL